jgi:hypothetical protein
VATVTARLAHERSLASEPLPADLGALVRASMYEPDYPRYS